MSLHPLPVETLTGEATTLGALAAGKATLVVNVASQCGLTPQYTALEALQKELGPERFTVLGVPCNQFGSQEPGSPEEIAQFCSANYGVSFPLLAKVDVNGADRHPLYEALTAFPDAEGKAGDVTWNFEKFLLDPEGEVLARFRPLVEPGDPALREQVLAALPPGPGSLVG